MAEIDPSIQQSVSEDNLKNIAGNPANAHAMLMSAAAAAQATIMQAAAVSFQDLVAASARRNQVADAAMAQAIKGFNEMDPQQALALSKGLSADLPDVLASLLAALNSGQEGVKAAQTTPPVTSPGPRAGV